MCVTTSEKKAGFFYLALLVAGQLVLAMFAITFAEYACSIIPGLNNTVVAFAILTLCYVMNIFGVDMAAKLQNVLVIVLVVAMGLFVAFGLPKVNWDVFVQPGAIMPSGLVGFLTGASLLTFATGGAEFLSELGGEMKNPGRDLPRAMISSTAIVAIIYAFIGVVAVGVLPVEEVAGQSLVLVADAIFPKPLYYFFIIGGGMFAVASTLNATFTWCTKGLLIAAEEGWLPKKAASISKFGTPWVLLTVFYIVGAIPILTGLDIETISRLGNGLSLIYVMFPIFAGYLIYKKNPPGHGQLHLQNEARSPGHPDHRGPGQLHHGCYPQLRRHPERLAADDWLLGHRADLRLPAGEEGKIHEQYCGQRHLSTLSQQRRIPSAIRASSPDTGGRGAGQFRKRAAKSAEGGTPSALFLPKRR